MAMSQYEYQQALKKAKGQSTSGKATNESGIRKKYYVKGMGYFEDEPLVSYDENGQRVVQTSGLQRDGGDRLAKAYDYVKAGLGDTLKRWQATRKAGFDTNDNNDSLNLYRHYKNSGVYDGDYAGFESWLNSYLKQAESEVLDVSALHNSLGVATKTSDGRLTQAGKEREGFGS